MPSLRIVDEFCPIGVVDAKQLDRHFTNDELSQLYRFETAVDDDPLDKYDADCVKDKILRHLMDKYADLIVSYREHDSLLIHRDEENLTAEEQKQAQDEGTPSPSKHRSLPHRRRCICRWPLEEAIVRPASSLARRLDHSRDPWPSDELPSATPASRVTYSSINEIFLSISLQSNKCVRVFSSERHRGTNEVFLTNQRKKDSPLEH